LRGPLEAKDRADLAAGWIDFADKLKGAERLAVLKRSAYWGTQAVQGLTGLAKAKLEGRLAKVVAEVSEAEAKEGYFTFYAGEWKVRFADGYEREYSIDANGKITCNDGRTGTLTRLRGEVVATFSDGRLDRYRLVGDNLQIDRYLVPADFPDKLLTAGLATPKR
jgi:hypothetical protein